MRFLLFPTVFTRQSHLGEAAGTAMDTWEHTI